ncbi:MAG: hypothetical protein KGN79_11040 [Acidobacteriota bacterium]|nr:hypothetical protein [Acidobacteriota bacterium]
MRIWLSFSSALLTSLVCAAQSPAPTNTPVPVAPTPSTLVRPAIDSVESAISHIRFDRWKRGDIRDEAQHDSSSILNDLHHPLPPLLEAADLAPDSNAKLVPAFQNIDAVYDVLLRVYSAARVVGQPEDVGSLDRALRDLSEGRKALAERMQAQAEAHEKLVHELRANNTELLAEKNAPKPEPPPCKPEPKHTTRKRTTHKTHTEKKPTESKPSPGKPK